MGVPGYSAAGLSSGLAQFGATLGGGMAQGVIAAALLPILLAVILGYAVYRLTKNSEQARSLPAQC
jgi:hypothetical protein